MKKMIVLFAVIVLLVSCQATPVPSASTPIPPTSAPVPAPIVADTEMLADSIDNVFGIGYAENGIFLDIKKGVGLRI